MMMYLRGAATGSDRDVRLARKLDQCTWTAATSFVAHGVKVGVRTNDPETLDQIVCRLPFGWEPATDSQSDGLFSVWVANPDDRGGNHRLYRECERVSRSRDLPWILGMVE